MNEEDDLIDEAESIAAAAWGEDFSLTAEDKQTLEEVFAAGERRSYHLGVEKLLGLKEAIFLSQLRWLLKNNEKRRKQRFISDYRGKWPAVYNTYNQWHEMLPSFSRSTIKRIITRLEKLQILLVKRAPWQKYYGINFKALAYFLQNPKDLTKLERKKLLK